MKRILWQMVLAVVVLAWVGSVFCAPVALAQAPLVLSLDGNSYEVQRPAGPRLAVRQFGSYTAYVRAALERGATLQEIGDSLADGMGTALEKTLLAHEIPPEDAKAVPGLRSLRYIADKEGRKFDRREVALALASLWDSGRCLPLVSHSCSAAVTLQQVRDCTRLLAKFSTYYNAEAKERSHNLQLCAASINGHILGANETFSFNAAVGKRTAQRGYLAANSIENGGYVLSVGGGVCQVSSTLYNAALLAGLSCVGRRHSLPVQYVDPARDAMVSEWSDMTICNTTEYPVYLFAWAQNGTVEVRLYGKPSAAEIRLYSEVVKRTKCQNEDEQGRLLADTAGYTLARPGSDGLSARLVRITDGHSEVIRTDVYSPRNAVWRKAE